MKIYDEKIKAVRLVSGIEDFTGGYVDDWKKAFYQLWRYQMTYDFAYQIEVRDHKDGPFVSLIVKPAFVKNVMDTMKELGYSNIQKMDWNVAVFYGYEHDDLEDIDFITID